MSAPRGRARGASRPRRSNSGQNQRRKWRSDRRDVPVHACSASRARAQAVLVPTFVLHIYIYIDSYYGTGPAAVESNGCGHAARRSAGHEPRRSGPPAGSTQTARPSTRRIVSRRHNAASHDVYLTACSTKTHNLAQHTHISVHDPAPCALIPPTGSPRDLPWISTDLPWISHLSRGLPSISMPRTARDRARDRARDHILDLVCLTHRPRGGANSSNSSNSSSADP